MQHGGLFPAPVLERAQQPSTPTICLVQQPIPQQNVALVEGQGILALVIGFALVTFQTLVHIWTFWGTSEEQTHALQGVELFVAGAPGEPR